MKGLLEIKKPTQGNDPALLPLYLDPNPMAPMNELERMEEEIQNRPRSILSLYRRCNLGFAVMLVWYIKILKGNSGGQILLTSQT